MRKRKIGGIALIICALLIMQLPIGSVEAASTGGMKIQGTTLVSYGGSEEAVSVPEGVEIIGSTAFEGSALTRVSFPRSLKRIEEYAFWGCDSLTEIVFGGGLTEVSDYAFTNCKGLKEVTLPEGITSIGIGAFADCGSLTDITIPPSVTFIHETAFDRCSALVIHAPEGSYASRYAKEFYQRQKQWEEYEDAGDYVPQEPEEVPGTQQPEPEDNTGLLGETSIVGNQAVFLLDNRKPTIYQGVLAQGGDQASESTAPLKYRIVSGGIVADLAYYMDKELQEVILPEGITQIGEFAFARTGSLAAVLPEGVTHIGYGAFYHSTALARIQLPSTVMTIEPRAFEHTAWVDDFLAGKDATQGDYLISGGALIAYRGNGQSVEIPEGVRVIAARAFMEHGEIRTVSFPESLQIIGEEAFAGCAQLQDIQLNQRVKKLADRAFAGCALREVTLPESVTGLGLGAFDREVEISFTGRAPERTYENSAKRLSNRAFRMAEPEEKYPGGQDGILVLGTAEAYASMPRTEGEYTLRLQANEDDAGRERAQSALQCAFGEKAPDRYLTYHMSLTDDSGVPITRLGKQTIQVHLPVPEELAGSRVRLLVYDANGQLEEREVTYEKAGETKFYSFSTNYVSDLILLPQGEEAVYEELTVQEVSYQTMARPKAAQEEASRSITTGMLLKWSLGAGLLLVGLFLALSRVK